MYCTVALRCQRNRKEEDKAELAVLIDGSMRCGEVSVGDAPFFPDSNTRQQKGDAHTNTDPSETFKT